LTNTGIIYSGKQEQAGETRCWLILLSFDVLVWVSLLLGIKVLLSFCPGYFIGNFGLPEKNQKKKKKVCVRERERELTLDFSLFYFFCYADFMKSVRYVHEKGDISIQCHLFK